ncbi:hypothetical protein Tco_0140603 [Tanacetum coccineum]
MVYCKKLEDSKIWVSTPTGEIRGEIGITTFRNDLRAHYLPHSSKYVTPPSLAVVRPWFATIGYSGEIRAKGTLKKSFLPPRWRVEVNFARLIWEDIIHKLNKKSRKKVVPYPRFISLLLEYMMPEYENDELTLNPTQMCLLISKLPTPPHKLIRRFPKAKSLELKVNSKENNLQNTHLSPKLTSTPVVDEMHKEELQTAGGSPSLGVTNEEGFNPHLSSGCDASADSIAEAHPRKSAPHDSIP